ncbi:hypothetical protein B0H13DRAFT_2268473, partial [Mycena leptocephala]
MAATSKARRPRSTVTISSVTILELSKSVLLPIQCDALVVANHEGSGHSGVQSKCAQTLNCWRAFLKHQIKHCAARKVLDKMHSSPPFLEAGIWCNTSKTSTEISSVRQLMCTPISCFLVGTLFLLPRLLSSHQDSRPRTASLLASPSLNPSWSNPHPGSLGLSQTRAAPSQSPTPQNLHHSAGHCSRLTLLPTNYHHRNTTPSSLSSTTATKISSPHPTFLSPHILRCRKSARACMEHSGGTLCDHYQYRWARCWGLTARRRQRAYFMMHCGDRCWLNMRKAKMLQWMSAEHAEAQNRLLAS